MQGEIQIMEEKFFALKYKLSSKSVRVHLNWSPDLGNCWASTKCPQIPIDINQLQGFIISWEETIAILFIKWFCHLCLQLLSSSTQHHFFWHKQVSAYTLSLLYNHGYLNTFWVFQKHQFSKWTAAGARSHWVVSRMATSITKALWWLKGILAMLI